MIGFVYKYHVPRFKHWIAVEIDKYSHQNLPARIWPENIEFTFVPLGIAFTDVKVTTQKGLEKTLLPTTIGRVHIRLSGLSLLKGQLRIGRIDVREADLRVFLKDSGQKQELPKIDFEALYQIPVDEIRIRQIRGGVTSDLAGGFTGAVKNLNVRIENRNRAIRLRLNAKDLRLKDNVTGKEVVFDFSTSALVDEEGMFFQSIRAKRDDSFVAANGSLFGNMSKLDLRHLKAKVRGQMNLPDITVFLRDIFGKNVPSLIGHASFEGNIEHQLQGGEPKANVEFNGTGLAIDRFQIGDVKVSAALASEKVVFNTLKVKSSAGSIDIQKGSLSTKKPYALTATLKADSLDLHSLLGQLDIDGVPVYSGIYTDLPCTGRLQKFELTCDGKILDSTIKVTTETKPGSHTIVDLEKVSAAGTVTVDSEKVTYKSKLRIGSSEGDTTGVISYQKGFKIDFQTKALNFKDVKNLSNIKFTGVVGAKGRTTGNASAATFWIDIDAAKATMDGFGLGNFKTKLTYRKGVLNFGSIAGRYNQSQYNGNVALNFKKDTLDVDVKAPFITLEDIQDLLKNRVPIPFDIEGNGSATVKLFGPFQLNKLSFTLSSSFFRGAIAGESFDQLYANIQAQNGRVQTQRLAAIKSSSQVEAKGSLSPQGIVDLNVAVKNYHLEQSETLSKLKLNLSGMLNMSGRLTGRFLKPNVEASGILSQVMIGNESAPDSSFRISLDEKRFIGEGSFSGGAVTTKISYPFSAQDAYSFALKTKEWNFGQLFTVLDESYRTNAFTTLVTSELNLTGTKRDLASSQGTLTVEKVLIRNGPAHLQNSDKMFLQLKNNQLVAQNFQLTGDAGAIKLTSREARPGHFNLFLDGKVDLLMVSVLTPFLDDLRGILTLNLNLTGRFQSPDLMGSTFLQNGFARLKGFPHAAEQVTADVLFSQKRIIINSAKGRLAGGTFSTSGKITFNDLYDLAVDIRGQVHDSVLKVPEGFTTRGSGEFFVTGNWFPYTVGVIFNVENGAIEKKIAAASKNTKGVRPSPYLPRFLLEQRFSPVTLDLDVTLRNPLPVSIEIPQLEIKAIAEGGVKVKGPPEQVLLTGRVNLVRGSRFILRKNIFEVTTGYVEYSDSAPENPTLNIIAESRITASFRDNEERDYDVVARVTGTANKPIIQMSSQPALPEKDLISLLTLGFIHDHNRNDNDTDTDAARTGLATSAGIQVLTDTLGVNQQLQKTLGVEVDYSSSYDSTDKAQLHTITVKKQWAPKFGTSASRTIGKSSTNNVKAEYKLNRNMSVIGRWEGREQTGANDEKTEVQQNQFGLDIEYRVKFK